MANGVPPGAELVLGPQGKGPHPAPGSAVGGGGGAPTGGGSHTAHNASHHHHSPHAHHPGNVPPSHPHAAASAAAATAALVAGHYPLGVMEAYAAHPAAAGLPIPGPWNCKQHNTSSMCKPGATYSCL